MVFTTTIFLFLFLPLFLALYYLLPFRYRSAWILTASLLFYGWWRPDFMLLMVAATLWSHILCRRIAETRVSDPSAARRALAFGIFLNIGTLGYFKYFNFGVESLNALIRGLGGSGLSAWEVILPIGISFYVFQATSYLIDVHRGTAAPARNYLDVAAYITLFPQLVAGPIVRYGEIARQLSARSHSFAAFSEGAQRFMIGFARKVLIADTVARIADAAFALPEPTAGDAWLGVAAYALQIFYDFSGYSDMAIGLGRMIGFRFPENFDRPYTSRSITEFWRRWHMSLSRWLRDYLYIPLGGNRRGLRRTYVNLLTVMIIGGLWHGAAWTFVLWGAWHGLWLVAERLLRDAGPRRLSGLLRPLGGNLYTLLIVLAGWVLFRAPNLEIAGEMALAMVGVHGGVSPGMAWQLSGLALTAFAAGVILVYAAPALGRLRQPRPSLQAAPGAGRVGVVAGRGLLNGAIFTLFLLSILKLVAESYSPFLYFQF